MPDILIHPTSQKQIQSFILHPSHAVLFLGPEGIGKRTLSDFLACQLLELPSSEALTTYPYITYITPEKDSISIEAVRDLQHFTKLKIPGSKTAAWRLIAIEHTELLTPEAQNAILKLLEEPPQDTIFLLSATTEQALLPTIQSRVQHISILQPAHQDVQAYFANLGYNTAKIQQAYLLSGGLPGLMTSLLSENEEHPLTKSVEQARAILRATTFERLSMVDTLAKDKTDTLCLFFVLQQMARAALTQSTTKEQRSAHQAIKQWQHILQETYQAENMLLTSAQPKLTLTNLFLNF